MRNDSGLVLREVEAGETFTVTRRGAPVAQIVPLGGGPRGYRPPRLDSAFSVDELIDADVSSADVLDALRADC
jgi:antitoxin (DNA-binding transcriptional repressor) of toxin-antitoxin stability system